MSVSCKIDLQPARLLAPDETVVNYDSNEAGPRNEFLFRNISA
jgi:hypothetical protein